MKDAFADTSYYLALVNPDDCSHDAAQHWVVHRWRRLITTEYVLLEMGNYLCKAVDKPTFANLILLIKTDPRTRLLPACPELFEAGCALYGQRLDKDWSLTDCISFVVMRREGLTDALTADKHFEQAGFNKLL
jgi:uncharacterized protein